MRIYLDNCCLQRPLDDQTQPRIRVETEAVLAVLAQVEAGKVALLTSEVLEFEIERNPDEQRRKEASVVLQLAAERVLVTGQAQAMAEVFEKQGIAAIDALHLAVASAAGADYFVTVDDKLLKKAQSITGLTCKVISVLGLVPEVSK